MSVLIGGGRGFVGRHLGKLLTEQGYKVTVVSRQTGKGQITWSDVERNGLPEKCTAVVNVAGENILNPLKRYSNKEYVREIFTSRVDTTRMLAKAIRDAEKKPDVFVTMSGVGFYPPSKTAEYTEISDGGDDWLGYLAAEWEKAGNLPENISTRRVIIRSGVVLGKDGGLIQNLRPLVKYYLGRMNLGTGEQWFPWIHVDDMAGLITYAIDSDHVAGILNGVAPDIVTNAQFTTAFASAFDDFPCLGSIPEFVIKLAFGPERALVVLEGQKVIPLRTERLGYKYKFFTIKMACTELAS